MSTLTRREMLAAELFGYSYDHYADRVGFNARFTEMMPEEVDILETAEQEGWDAARIAEALEMPEERVEDWQQHYRDVKEIVDAPTAAEGFRRGVRLSIRNAVEEGLEDKASMERLVTQICYRAADLGFRLEMEGKSLAEYSENLRQETEYDAEYNRKMLDELFGKDETAP